MASRLEMVVSNRSANKCGKMHLLETSSCQKDGKMTLEMESSKCLDGYKEFFLILKNALSVDDHAKSLQLLNQARGLANELISS